MERTKQSKRKGAFHIKALILAAGKGTRLRPLTWFIPKPLIKIKGKAVVDRIIEWLWQYGINDIVINLHYKPHKFMKHFGNKVLYFYEPKLLGEEGTIYSLRHWIGNDYCLVINGDTLTNLNLNIMLDLTKGKNAKFVDGKTYAGYRILPPGYKFGDQFIEYRDGEAWWVDCGTFKGLRKAKQLV